MLNKIRASEMFNAHLDLAMECRHKDAMINRFMREWHILSAFEAGENIPFYDVRLAISRAKTKAAILKPTFTSPEYSLVCAIIKACEADLDLDDKADRVASALMSLVEYTIIAHIVSTLVGVS